MSAPCSLGAAAGAKRQPVFDDGAVDALFDATTGVPRRLNTLATSALTVAASRKRKLVSTQDFSGSNKRS